MDDYRKKLHQSLGWMASIKCDCCNPTITMGKNKQHNVTIYNKMARTKLKVETKQMVKEDYE